MLCTLLTALSILKATILWSRAAKAALERHVPRQPLLVGENKAQQRASPCWLLCHLEKEVIINTLQEPPVLLMACCVVLPTDIVMVEVPREGEGL